MRIFEHPNKEMNWRCPICGKDTDKPVVLAGIYGTEDGGNIQAEQIHLDCIDLTYYKDMNALAMKWQDAQEYVNELRDEWDKKEDA